MKDEAKYRRLVGCIIYLTVTQPDLVYIVHILSQFMHAPREEHMEAARQVMHSLKETAGLSSFLKAD